MNHKKTELNVNVGRILRYTAHLLKLESYLEMAQKFWNTEESCIAPYYKGQLTKALKLTKRYIEVMPKTIRPMDADRSSEEIDKLITRSTKRNKDGTEEAEKLPFDFECSLYGIKFSLEAMKQNQKEVSKISQLDVNFENIYRYVKPYFILCEKNILSVGGK